MTTWHGDLEFLSPEYHDFIKVKRFVVGEEKVEFTIILTWDRKRYEMKEKALLVRPGVYQTGQNIGPWDDMTLEFHVAQKGQKLEVSEESWAKCSADEDPEKRWHFEGGLEQK